MPKVVVIIDDDPDDLEILKEAIADIDPSIDCLSFIYADEAVRLLSSRDQILKPDFIFIDINMPKKMGGECLNELRKVRSLDESRIIMHSTSMPEKAAQQLKSAGANFAFQKPYSIGDYKEIVKTILGGR